MLREKAAELTYAHSAFGAWNGTAVLEIETMRATEVITATSIETTDDELVIRLADREVRIPWAQCSPILANATAEQFRRVRETHHDHLIDNTHGAFHAPYAFSSRSNSSSEITGTPSSWALASLLPAFSPATK